MWLIVSDWPTERECVLIDDSHCWSTALTIHFLPMAGRNSSILTGTWLTWCEQCQGVRWVLAPYGRYQAVTGPRHQRRPSASGHIGRLGGRTVGPHVITTQPHTWAFDHGFARWTLALNGQIPYSILTGMEQMNTTLWHLLGSVLNIWRKKRRVL